MNVDCTQNISEKQSGSGNETRAKVNEEKPKEAGREHERKTKDNRKKGKIARRRFCSQRI